jgi:AcrR family transcriptional regulator
MREGTREDLLEAAKRQFAEKGFHGASISQMAGELGLTKQALLYHFKRKEDLYAEVMQEVSNRLLRFVKGSLQRKDTPERQLEQILLGIYTSSLKYPMDTRLLVREMLDNPARADKAKGWYLKPFLEEIIGVAKRIERFKSLSETSVFCIVYQLIGSIEYFAISEATLKNMYGVETYEGFSRDFPIELRNQITSVINGKVSASESV